MRLSFPLLVLVASAASATPPGEVSPMTLPGAGGYMQPGNPDRGISSVGRESALARSQHPHLGHVTCSAKPGRSKRCEVGDGTIKLERRLAGRCRSGRDWFREGGAVRVTNGCAAVFSALG